MKKTFILDTNVLLSDSNALFAFEDNDIIIPMIVLEELDKHKSRQDEVGANARAMNRKLDELRIQGSLHAGIKTPGGGTLYVQSTSEDTLKNLPIEFQNTKADNLIISLALHKSATLVSKDINVRVKCDALNVQCDDYKKSQIISKIDDLYSGVIQCEATKEFIDSLYKNDYVEVDSNQSNIISECLFPNQIVIIKQYGCESGSTIVKAIRKNENEKFYFKQVNKRETCYGLTPRNKEQNFSLDLLLDERIKLVTLTGIAGSGKSLLALAAGLAQNHIMGDADKKKYQKLIIARSLQPVGKDTGFLPGTLLEKLAPWQGPTIDNLHYLLSKGDKKISIAAKTNKKPFQIDEQQIDPYLSLLMERGVIEIASISHIRGRSIPDAYCIIEEAQNMSVTEIKTVISRVGEGTKMILVGDVDQIDNLYVDKYSNGLSHVIEKFKNSNIAAHVTLRKGERSQLATEAAHLL